MPVDTAPATITDTVLEGRSIVRGIILHRGITERADGVTGVPDGQLAIAASQSAEMGGAPIRKNGVPTEWDMKYISKLSPYPDSLKPESLYVFEAAPSNQQIDSLLTRMDISSLQNYSQDAFGGVAVMNSHRTGISSPATLPIGRSFYGAVEADPSYPGTQRFVAASYILRNNRASGENTDDIIAGIDSGTIFDNSIGFRMIPGTIQKNFTDRSWYKCSICGADWANEGPQSAGSGGMFGNVEETKTNCNHWPGELYDGKMCYLWVMNARLGEFSLVYAGACDGAVILKARKAAARGDLTRGQVRRLENIYQARIAGTTLYAAPITDFLRPIEVPALEALPDTEEALALGRGAEQNAILPTENADATVLPQTSNADEFPVPVSGLPLETDTNSENHGTEISGITSKEAELLSIWRQRNSEVSDAQADSAVDFFRASITNDTHRVQELVNDFSEVTPVTGSQEYGGTNVSEQDTNRAGGKKTKTDFHAPTPDQDDLVTGDKPSKYPTVKNHDATESYKSAGTIKTPKVGKVTAPPNNREDDSDADNELEDDNAEVTMELSDTEDEELSDDSDEAQELSLEDSTELMAAANSTPDEDMDSGDVPPKPKSKRSKDEEGDEIGDVDAEIPALPKTKSRADRKVQAPAGCMDPDCDDTNCDDPSHMQGRMPMQKKIPSSKSTDWDDNMGEGEDVPEGEIKTKLKGAMQKNTTKRDLSDFPDDEDEDDDVPAPGTKSRTSSDTNRVARPAVVPAKPQRDPFAAERSGFIETIQRFKANQLQANQRIADLERTVSQLRPNAQIGLDYRRSLIDETVRFAITAEIPGMDEEMVNNMCRKLDIKTIKVLRENYQQQAQGKFGQLSLDGSPTLTGGRQTMPADPNSQYQETNEEFRELMDPFTAHPSVDNHEKVGSTFSFDGYN